MIKAKRSWVLVGAGVLLAAGCGSSAKATSSATSIPVTTAAPTTTVARGSGPVDVLYAGSLVNVMEKEIGPAFNAATGYTFQGFSAGSTALAAQIKGKVRQGDVFISASPSVNETLMGSSNGDWVSWYVTFADSPLVIGYNPHSKFAEDLQTKPWYEVITEPGFLIGRTDPATDPKGKLTEQALAEAAKMYNLPALNQITASSSNVYPEETLVGRLQAGQLDAGFFYTSETTAAGVPTIELTGIALKATYTVTVLNQAPHQAGAEAFTSYLLGPEAQAILTKSGFHLVQPPTVTGSGVPASVSSAVSG
ncbi:MAG TPA: extracellular solute-binding protein [Acidimicrobiales bacterium]|nr:extracellular solute-binding protein [Acidimicrobiales bacterium]